MSVSTRNRVLLFAGALLLAAQAVLAGNPSARTDARMVYEPTTGNTILFGGETLFDAGTSRSYDLDETWLFNGVRWVQRYPQNVPEARSAQIMVWDSNRNRIVMFGGHDQTTDLSDTWTYANNDWTQLNPATSASKRRFAGAAYDPIRDRIVMFGGYALSADGKKLDPLYDTWEFDGTNWKQVSTNGPTVLKPSLVYDAARNKLLMLAMTDKEVTQMYSWNGSSWDQLTPAKLPSCVSQGAMLYLPTEAKPLFVGGLCTATADNNEETWLWDGTTWTKNDAKLAVDRAYGQAVAYDARRNYALMFGGSTVVNEIRPTTYVYQSGEWIAFSDVSTPGPRSLSIFRTDQTANGIWMLGGLNDNSFYSDFWKFQNNQWLPQATTDTTPGCFSSIGALDTDRKKMVVLCSTTGTTYEFDGTTWTQAKDLKKTPTYRRFAGMVYDPSIKKTVVVGGWDESSYLNDTWTWDGTQWVEVKKNRPTSRSLPIVFYDPVSKKTLMYGGLGRPTSEDRVERYSDMWSFDGTGWTKMTVTNTPGPRYGASVAFNPVTQQTILFGGVYYERPTPKTEKQSYVDDTWTWDGTAWKKLELEPRPFARENGALAYDPSQDQMVLFGGWNGHFLSDVWTLKNGKWTLKSESLARRRTGGQQARVTPPTTPSDVTNNE